MERVRISQGTLAVRALNYWSRVFIPTYAGLRLLLEQTPTLDRTNYLDDMLFRGAQTGKQGRYRRFIQVKSVSAVGPVRHRACHAASPTTALAEALALAIMADIPTLKNKRQVFSYRWPDRRREGQSYRYYWPAYEERNMRVSRLLQAEPKERVLAFDVKDFYPSVKKDGVRVRLGQHLLAIRDDREREFAGSVCDAALELGATGIAVGPAPC